MSLSEHNDSYPELDGRSGTHVGFDTNIGKRAPKNKIFYPYSGTTAVIDHEITTRRADAELLSRVDVVEQM